jgi:hypothetical protein
MSKKANRSNIKIVRFKNGDTIIASLTIDSTDESFYYYVIERPMQINMLPVLSKKGIQSMTIFMQEWLEYSKDTIFKIPEDVIMLIANPEDEMIEEYLDALEKNELHRIQRQFEDISKNYDKENEEEEDATYPNVGYNNEYEDEIYDEETEEDDPEDGRSDPPD